MPIDQLANYAEVFGGAAVIISLIYLAIQVRANTREQRHRRRIETFEVQNTVQDFMAGDNTVSQTFTKAATDYNSLTMAERVKFLNMYLKCFTAWDLVIAMHKDGEISDEALRNFESYMESSFAYPMIRHWWKTMPWTGQVPKRVADRINAFVKRADAENMVPSAWPPYKDEGMV